MAGVAINIALGDNGLFSKSKEAVETHKIAAAREKLQLTLQEAMLDKEINPAATQDDYLDKLIIDKIPGAEILGNIVVVDGYMFEIDKNGPGITGYVGPAGNVKYPDIEATVTTASDGKSATINIKAKEDENGINKIEIILDGNVIETINCSGSREEINTSYQVTQNGSYTIKAYSNLSKSAVAEVNGIMMSMSYEPNGSSNWQKSYSVKLSVDDASDPVTSIKYKWLTDIAGITEGNFTDAESCNNGETVEKGELTGTYYLWTMITTESGKTNVNRSNAFYFDNEGPVFKNFKTSPNSLTTFALTGMVYDNSSTNIKMAILINETNVSLNVNSEEDIDELITVDKTGVYSLQINLEDSLGNKSHYVIDGRTKLYTWKRYQGTNGYTEYMCTRGTGTTSLYVYLSDGSSSRNKYYEVSEWVDTNTVWLKDGESCTGQVPSVGKFVLGRVDMFSNPKSKKYIARVIQGEVTGTSKNVPNEKWNFVKTREIMDKSDTYTLVTSENENQYECGTWVNSYWYEITDPS